MQEARIDTEAMGRICANGTSIECMAAMFEEYADRTCYGQCEPNKSDFTLLTFGQVWDRIKVCMRCQPVLQHTCLSAVACGSAADVLQHHAAAQCGMLSLSCLQNYLLAARQGRMHSVGVCMRRNWRPCGRRAAW